MEIAQIGVVSWVMLNDETVFTKSAYNGKSAGVAAEPGIKPFCLSLKKSCTI